MEDKDQLVIIETHSWVDRIKSSLGGIFLGIPMFIGSFFVLTWNEGRSVEMYKSLKEGQNITHTITSHPIDPQNDGKLVHLYGLANTKEQLNDPVFNVAVNANALKRQVEMYQWIEKEKSETSKALIGGSTTTRHTYTYTPAWSSQTINSSTFKNKEGHINPSSWEYNTQILLAKKIELGDFELSASQISRLDIFEPINLDSTALPDNLKNVVLQKNNNYYLGKNPDNPEIGDLKISYSIIKPTEITIVAKQVNNTFEPYETRAGDKMDMLKMGDHSLEEMYKDAFSQNTRLTWGLRLGGILLMGSGLMLIFKPLIIIAEILPIIGYLFSFGIEALVGNLTLSLSLITISLSWMIYHPLIGSGLLIIGIALPVSFIYLKNTHAQNPPLKPN